MLIRREDFGDLKKLSKGSHKKIWFTCDNCGIGILQEYRNYLNQKEGKFCRSCRNKHTAKKDDVRKKQSDFMKNKWKDENYRIKMSKKLSESCKKAWDNDTGKRRQNLSENNPMKNPEIIEKVRMGESISINEIKKLVEKYGYKLIERVFKRGGSYLLVECGKGHRTWKYLYSFRTGGHSGCRICNQSDSKAEIEITQFLDRLNIEYQRNRRDIISPYEIDIYIPSKNLCIEYCGLYWHSENKGKDRKYHLNKLEECESKGLRLITIFEDEWTNKRNIVKSRLSYILGLENRRIYARQCTIREISTKEARTFIEQYHIQGYSGSSIKLGSFYKDRLVSVMTFSRPSIAKGSKNKQGVWELNRFCSSCNVIGIPSKFLSYFKKNYEWDQIFSYADRRWSNGNLYEKIGFEFSHNTPPNYWYHHGNEQKRIHRFVLRKRKDEPKDKTEVELRKIEGYNRIWDCGNKKYIMKKG